MRPGQQNRRSRNRNNNRKNPNPLSRNYESNGPDVKIRGNAQHIADKYAQLARDATGSGDRVMAENYLQHAEHYNRIIAAAQASQQQAREREEEDNAEQTEAETAAAPDGEPGGTGPQPVIDGVPAEVALEEKAVSPATEDEQRPRRARGRRPRKSDNGGEAPSEASGEDADATPKPRKSSRPARSDKDGDKAETSEDGSTIGWLAAAGQD